jgi:DNA-directed RNA polymerase beta' subunit
VFVLKFVVVLGVIGAKTTSNHIMEVQKVLGIEAARATIVKEIHHTMSAHGLSVDWRHLSLLGDTMCFKVSKRSLCARVVLQSD